jgi:hypothetical protein
MRIKMTAPLFLLFGLSLVIPGLATSGAQHDRDVSRAGDFEDEFVTPLQAFERQREPAKLVRVAPSTNRPACGDSAGQPA